MITHALPRKKQQQTYITGEIHSHVLTIPKLKKPTLSCITDSKTQKTHIPTTSTLAQKPSNKGRNHIIFHDANQQYTPAAYHSNLNTSQQELLCLHETYAHADMREIQQQIKTVKLKHKDK
jgi:hypothetical protein